MRTREELKKEHLDDDRVNSIKSGEGRRILEVLLDIRDLLIKIDEKPIISK